MSKTPRIEAGNAKTCTIAVGGKRYAAIIVITERIVKAKPALKLIDAGRSRG